MELYKRIDALLHKERVVIAIDGPSGSGKSTLSDTLKEKYNATVIHIDDFFLPATMKTKDRLREAGGNFHYERFITEIINKLDEAVLHYQKFNCKTEQLEPVEEELSQLVVIEGCYSHHLLLRGYYDLTIFLDVPEEIQLKRIKERSGEMMFKRFVSEWIPLENKYFDIQEIRQKSDIIIKNY